MLAPTKFTRLEESTIFKMRSIFEGRQNGDSIQDLLARTLNKFTDISEFLDALDVLFVLGLIDVDQSTGAVEYAR